MLQNTIKLFQKTCLLKICNERSTSSLITVRITLEAEALEICFIFPRSSFLIKKWNEHIDLWKTSCGYNFENSLPGASIHHSKLLLDSQAKFMKRLLFNTHCSESFRLAHRCSFFSQLFWYYYFLETLLLCKWLGIYWTL